MLDLFSGERIKTPVIMTQSPTSPGRILVAIASYGKGNDRYLAQVVQEYRSMPFDIDIIMVSNLPKEVGSGVEVVVGLPDKAPWSLPFAHKAIFAKRVNGQYQSISGINQRPARGRNCRIPAHRKRA